MYGLRKLEILLLDKLEQFSPPLHNQNGEQVRKHKLVEIHVAPGTASEDLDSAFSHAGKRDLRDGVTARVCRKAGEEFCTLLRDKVREKENLYIGIGWSQTCEMFVNLMHTLKESFSGVTICPLLGQIGHKEFSIDSNFLAYRLAARLSGTSIKLPCPAICRPGLNLQKNLPDVAAALRPVAPGEFGAPALMVSDTWLLPEGIEEVLPERAARLETQRQDVLSCFSIRG